MRHARNGLLEALDLEAIGSRWSLARMAGEAADDAGEGWDNGKIRAVLRSWGDVRDLFNAVKREREIQAGGTAPDEHLWLVADDPATYSPKSYRWCPGCLTVQVMTFDGWSTIAVLTRRKSAL